MWDLVPRVGIKPGHPALGAQSLNQWTTREVLHMILSNRGEVYIFFLLFPKYRNIAYYYRQERTFLKKKFRSPIILLC